MMYVVFLDNLTSFLRLKPNSAAKSFADLSQNISFNSLELPAHTPSHTGLGIQYLRSHALLIDASEVVGSITSDTKSRVFAGVEPATYLISCNIHFFLCSLPIAADKDFPDLPSFRIDPSPTRLQRLSQITAATMKPPNFSFFKVHCRSVRAENVEYSHLESDHRAWSLLAIASETVSEIAAIVTTEM